MNEIEYRAVIRFLFLKKKTNDEIKIELDDVYGDSALSLSTIKYWTAEFKRGRTIIFDDGRTGRPREVATPEVVDKIHGMVIDDRRVRVCEIAKAVGMSRDRVENILHEYLGMRKLAARWEPHLLNADNKRNRVTTSKECLAMFNHNKKDFLRHFVTVDETWIHHNTPDTKEQSNQ
ncbi:protein GVQW3-like [Sitophilus oryzae]|uniref:Protein GVQW3-like n=1 Tax=Sitophilus oryzae TaxID=7048 RepID=A0A6J2XIV7_SITOR|nr:protein GVQW3-like [Sitophilus oryzae]